MKNHVGKLILFDVTGFLRTEQLFKTKIIPALDELKKAYNLLGIGEFNQEVYQTLHLKGIAEIKKQYDTVLDSEVSKMKLPALSKRIADTLIENPPLEDVERAWANVLAMGANASNHILQTNVNYSFLNYDSKKAFWLIDYDAIRKTYQDFIETEQQSNLYNRLLQLQELHKELRNEISQLPKKENRFICVPPIVTIISDQQGGGLIYEDNDGAAHLDLSYFINLFNVKN